MKTNKNTIVYIDGFNLYFGLRASSYSAGSKKISKKSYWLNLQKLAENLVQERNLVGVKYFTARIKGNSQKQQNTYLEALQVYCTKLSIFEGRYLLRDFTCSKCHQITDTFVCPKCKYSNHLPEEKKSDVNIAVQILKDAFENKFDTAYLISGDSDLVPPIEIVRLMLPPKKVIVVFPPLRYSKELEDKSDIVLHLKPKMIYNSLLPEEIVCSVGKKLVIPEEWNK
jgi:uncharacterized LabA/DUF88 family protein